MSEEGHKLFYYNSKTKLYFVEEHINYEDCVDNFGEPPRYLVLYGRKGGVIKHKIMGWELVNEIQHLLRNGYDMITVDEMKKIKYNILDEMEKLKTWYLLKA